MSHLSALIARVDASLESSWRSLKWCVCLWVANYTSFYACTWATLIARINVCWRRYNLKGVHSELSEAASSGQTCNLTKYFTLSVLLIQEGKSAAPQRKDVLEGLWSWRWKGSEEAGEQQQRSTRILFQSKFAISKWLSFTPISCQSFILFTSLKICI